MLGIKQNLQNKSSRHLHDDIEFFTMGSFNWYNSYECKWDYIINQKDTWNFESFSKILSDYLTFFIFFYYFDDIISINVFTIKYII